MMVMMMVVVVAVVHVRHCCVEMFGACVQLRDYSYNIGDRDLDDFNTILTQNNVQDVDDTCKQFVAELWHYS